MDVTESQPGTRIQAGAKRRIGDLLLRSLTLIDRWAILILVVLATSTILFRLGETSLLDWDESIYAQVAREMIQSGDWINLQHGYRPYFEKPPLLMWSIALSYKLLGVNELAARLPSAVSAILLVALTYISAKSMYGGRTGLLAGLILVSSFGYIFQSRNGTTNMPLTLYVFLGIFAYQRVRHGTPKCWYLFFISFALAFMTKFWAALILPMVVLIVIVLEGRLREVLNTKHFWLGLLLAALIVTPWHVLAYLESGQAFIDAYVTRNLVQRGLTVLEEHSGSTLFYVNVLRNYLSPWLFLIPFALASGIGEWVNQERKSDILILLILATFGLYTFAIQTKLDAYVLPIFPALAILIAQLFVLAASKSHSNYFVYFLLSGALIAAPVAQNMVLLLFSFMAVALFVLIKLRILSTAQLPQIIATLTFAGFAIVGTLNYVQGNNRLDTWSLYRIPDSPVSQIAALAGKRNPSIEAPLFAYYPHEPNLERFTTVQGPAATFYSNRHVIVVESWEQLVEQMRSQGSGEILIAERYLDPLAADFDLSVIERVRPLVYAEFHRK